MKYTFFYIFTAVKYSFLLKFALYMYLINIFLYCVPLYIINGVVSLPDPTSYDNIIHRKCVGRVEKSVFFILK